VDRVRLMLLISAVAGCASAAHVHPHEPGPPAHCFDIDGPEREGWGELRLVFLTDGRACWHHDGADVFGEGCSLWEQKESRILLRPCQDLESLQWPVVPTYMSKSAITGTLSNSGNLSIDELLDFTGAIVAQQWRRSRV
jgi:hypothetical protein